MNTPHSFTIEGEPVTLADILATNADDPEICEWARSAKPGDRFPAFVDVQCVA